MKLHWKVLLWMLAGAVLGFVLQKTLDAPAWAGARWEEAPGGLKLVAVEKGSPAAGKRGPTLGRVYGSAIRHRGVERPGDAPPDAEGYESTYALVKSGDIADVLARCENGELLWLMPADPGEEPAGIALGIDPDSSRAKALVPFEWVATIFMSLLKLLIVPLVMSSIIAGVAGVGEMRDLRRLGGKTLGYYVTTSMLAILVGQALVSVIRPGDGAPLGLARYVKGPGGSMNEFAEVVLRMVPENVVAAMTDNGSMLQIIVFSLLFGLFITRAPEPARTRVRELVEGIFAVMLRMAEGVLLLLPYGVFALIVKVVARTGFGVFVPLLLYMITVLAALLIHACVTLPVFLRIVGGVSPLRWFRAMAPALMTAFSTSSSSMTLPVTLETVEKRGRVSNKITSFTLPLGATVNMDGTALYECIGVIFLAQFYATSGQATAGDPFVLTLGTQAIVVIMALLASIGAAGIPSAGLVMMLTILSVLGLPIEGAALLLAVDRPLDMLRTVVNVWSDTCGAAVISRSEGETGPLEAGALEAGAPSG